MSGHIILEPNGRVLSCIHASSGAVVPGAEMYSLEPSINDDGVVTIEDGRVFYEGDVLFRRRLMTKLEDCSSLKTCCHFSSKRRYGKFVELNVEIEKKAGLILALNRIDREQGNPSSSIFDNGMFVRLGPDINRVPAEEIFEPDDSLTEEMSEEEFNQESVEQIVDESVEAQTKPFELVASGYSDKGIIYEVYDNGSETMVKKIMVNQEVA